MTIELTHEEVLEAARELVANMLSDMIEDMPDEYNAALAFVEEEHPRDEGGKFSKKQSRATERAHEATDEAYSNYVPGHPMEKHLHGIIAQSANIEEHGTHEARNKAHAEVAELHNDFAEWHANHMRESPSEHKRLQALHLKAQKKHAEAAKLYETQPKPEPAPEEQVEESPAPVEEPQAEVVEEPQPITDVEEEPVYEEQGESEPGVLARITNYIRNLLSGKEEEEEAPEEEPETQVEEPPVEPPPPEEPPSAPSKYKPSVSLTHVEQRAFTGKPVATETKLSKIQTRRLGENIITAHLQMSGSEDARPMNYGHADYPIDLVHDHETVEVKTGMVSNAAKSQHWRSTIGTPGKAESALLATMTAEEKRTWNRKKQAAIVKRKEAALKRVSKELGYEVKAKTYGVLINPDTKTADIYEFDGMHERIGWNSPEATRGYKRTVQYEDT